MKTRKTKKQVKDSKKELLRNGLVETKNRKQTSDYAKMSQPKSKTPTWIVPKIALNSNINDSMKNQDFITD